MSIKCIFNPHLNNKKVAEIFNSHVKDRILIIILEKKLNDILFTENEIGEKCSMVQFLIFSFFLLMFSIKNLLVSRRNEWKWNWWRHNFVPFSIHSRLISIRLMFFVKKNVLFSTWNGWKMKQIEYKIWFINDSESFNMHIVDVFC